MKIFAYILAFIHLVLLTPVDMLSHHQLGLPHYLYSKEYPQIPTMAIDADAEGYMVTFSIFPGNPRPNETVRMKVYIKHKVTGVPYSKPIKMSVSRITFLSGEEIVKEERTLESEFNEYKSTFEFDSAEQFFVNVTFEPRNDFFEKIPFPVVIGTTNFSLIPIFSGLFFLAVFIVVGITKKKTAKISEYEKLKELVDVDD